MNTYVPHDIHTYPNYGWSFIPPRTVVWNVTYTSSLTIHNYLNYIYIVLIIYIYIIHITYKYGFLTVFLKTGATLNSRALLNHDVQ